jgi:NHLM bacteriocin system ABC transporter ATP-binding protein
MTILRSGDTLGMNDGRAAWRVEAGAAAVFAVESEGGGRRYLFDAGPGDLLRGMTPPAEARHGLVAVAIEPAVLAQVDTEELPPAASLGWDDKLASVTSRVGGGFFEALAQLDDLSQAEERSRREEQGLLNRLLPTAQTVAAAQGIQLRAPACGGDSAQEPLQAIAEASGVRVRAVNLAGAWWEQDNGPILAYRVCGMEPVALLPSGRGYDLVEPGSEFRQPVNASMVATLHAQAHVFYRSFNGGRGAWDLIRFGLHGFGKDLRNMLLCGIAMVLFAVVMPQAVALLFAHAIPDADRSLLLQLAIAMAASAFGAMLFDLTRAVSALRMQTAMSAALQAATWDWLLKLSPSFFRRFSAGDLRARVEGVRSIGALIRPETQRAILVGLSAFLYLALMFWHSPALAALAAACALLVMICAAVCCAALSRMQDSLLEAEGALLGQMVQLINAIPKFRVANAEERAFAWWGNAYGRKQKLGDRIQAMQDRLRLVTGVAPVLATAISFGVAVRGSGIELGAFLAFSLAFGGFMQAITELSDTASGMVSIATHWRRAKTILDTAPEADAAKANPGRLTGRLALDRVTFRYRENGRATLEDVSLHAAPGECIALVGPSGSGKSTILNLLLGFESVASGRVLIDGRDLCGLDPTAVRRQIGVVRQDSRLSAQSIFENIVCGSRFTMEEAWEAARAAGMAEDIEQMPMGMHTIVSEGGANLSGGQRQRLLIARALVMKPRVLLFDEATSALDNRTQQIVTESMKLMKATRLIVAHRLSTIRHADRIYVIEAGRVVQQGTFNELAEQPGLFRRLMTRQMM